MHPRLSRILNEACPALDRKIEFKAPAGEAFFLSGLYYKKKNQSQNAQLFFDEAIRHGFAPAQLSCAQSAMQKALKPLQTLAPEILEKRKRLFLKALQLYREAAQKGLAKAQYSFAFYLERGLPIPINDAKTAVPPDLKSAIGWYTKAASQDDIPSMFRLGLYFRNELKNEKDAFDCFQKAAEFGHSYSQYEVGNCYLYGIGVSQNIEEAKKWFTLAAENHHLVSQLILVRLSENEESLLKWLTRAALQGDPASQIALAERYSTGNGVPLDNAKAIEWYRRTAKQGHKESQYQLALLLKQEKSTLFFHWLFKATEQNHVEASHQLSQSLVNGEITPEKILPKQKADAFLYWLFPAKVPHSIEQSVLNNEIKYERFVKLPRKLKVDPAVLCQLALCYLLSPVNDLEKAALWFKLAAIQGNSIGQRGFAICLEKGRGVPQDEKLAVKWMESSAQLGYLHSQYDLGMYFLKGKGVAQDEQKAREWFTRAANKGHEGAKQFLTRS